jgi:hypothetical protein
MSAAAAGPSLALKLNPALAAFVVDAVAERITQVMRDYGIPGRARVTILRAEGARAVSVFVDGRAAPYPPSFLRRLWFGLAPAALQPMAFDGGAEQRYPDGWLVACAESETPGVHDVLRELVPRLVEEVVSLRPSLLLTPAALGAAEGDSLVIVGRALVDRGVTLPELDDLAELIREHDAAGRTPEDTLEDIYARLRSPRVELHLHGDVLAPLAGSRDVDRIETDDPSLDPDMAAAMAAIRAYHLVDLGVRLPVVLVRSDSVEPDELRVKLNDRLGPPVPIPRPDEVGVSARMSDLAAHGIPARPLVDAVTGHEFAAVPADAAATVQALGLTPARPGAYVAAAFGRSVSPLAHRLLSVEEVEQDLAECEQTFPSLVHGVLSRYRLTEVTHVYRALLLEQVSIRDSWHVLNAMLCYASLRAMDASDLPPEMLSRPAVDGYTGPSADGRMVAFVRREMGDRVAYDSGALDTVGPGAMTVYVTDGDFETRLAKLAGAPGQDEELISIRDHVWRALGDEPPPQPVFVTGTRVRRALRDVLGFELPGARVLSRAELPPEVDLRPLGIVTGSV